MPRHLSLVAYNTPPTPASQDHSSCETFASAPLRLNSPLFLSYVGPQSPLVRPRASHPPLYSWLRSHRNRPGTAVLRCAADFKKSYQILLILLILSKTSTRSTCSTRLTIFSFVYLVYFVVQSSLRTLRPCASALKKSAANLPRLSEDHLIQIT